MLLRKLINYYLPLWDFLYILQLEEYATARYIHQVRLRILKRNFAVRDQLQYTTRILIIMLASVGLLACYSSIFWHLGGFISFVVCILTIPFVTPLCIAASSVITRPFIAWQKHRVLQSAQRYFAAHYPDTNVIAITGSFGKTTTKYLLQHVLQYDYRVAIIPENYNTSLGIAQHILADRIPAKTEYLIVEMGAYTEGDIREAAYVTPPDIAILTIYGDQHLERFGDFAALVRGKSEIFTTHEKTTAYLSTRDYAVAKANGISLEKLQTVAVPAGEKTTPYLVSAVATALGVSQTSINASLESFTPPDRRNNLLVRDGVTIIDNSYNISPMVAETMIKEGYETARQQNKKLVVMTGGIGEQGQQTPEVNQALAELLNTYADQAIINETVYAPHITANLSIPYSTNRLRTDVTDRPADWLDAESEILLWLTGHSDLSYV